MQGTVILGNWLNSSTVGQTRWKYSATVRSDSDDILWKTKVSVSDCDNSINISMFNQLNNSTQLYKIQPQAGGEFNVAEVSFENMVDYDQIVFHDSAVLLHSDDKCSIRIHDFLHPFLLWGLTEISEILCGHPKNQNLYFQPKKRFFHSVRELKFYPLPKVLYQIDQIF